MFRQWQETIGGTQMFEAQMFSVNSKLQQAE